MNRRKVIGVAVSLIVAVLGTVVLLGYVNSKDKTSTPVAVNTNVLVVKKPIKAGTAAESLGDSVAVEAFPQDKVAIGTVASVDELKGLVASINLEPGEVVLKTRFVTAQENSRGKIPPDLLTVTIPFSPHQALGGRIEPGFRVAVIGLFKKEDPFPQQSKVLMHRVLVAAVQATAPVEVQNDRSRPPEGGLLITFAVDVASAERLTFAHDNGTLWLANEPEEAPVAGSQVITRENVYP